MPILSDEITLDGVKYPVTGFGRVLSASEFETGIKVGPASYDNREHAFFHVFNDFSGGLGYRTLNVRDEQGTFWSSDSLDTRRPSHITLGPYYESVSPDTDPTIPPDIDRLPSHPWARLDNGQWVMGVGGAIYRSTLDLTAWNIVDNATGSTTLQVSSIIRTTEPGSVPGDAAFMASYSGRGSTQRYRISHNGSVWTNGAANKALLDLIWWDNKVLAVEGITIIYGIIDSTGTESWNTDDVDDGQAIVTVPTARYTNGTTTGSRLRFIGIAPSPADGSNVVYFTDGREVFYLDFYMRRYHKIDIDIPVQALHAATIWQGDVIFSDGWEVWSYGGSNGTLRPIGLPKRSGIPPYMDDTYGQLTTSRMIILGLWPAAEFLYAIGVSGLEDAAGTCVTQLLCYNGVGWHQLAAFTTPAAGLYGFVAAPSTMADTGPRKIIVPTLNALDESDTNVVVYQAHMPSTGQTPQVSIDKFGSPGHVMTGWLDGGFNDVPGTLLRLNIDAFGLDSANYVRAYYQLNNGEGNDWTQLVNANGAAAYFDGTTTELFFTGDGPGLGKSFRTVRFLFQVTGDTSGDRTESPEIRAITLTFLKTPPLRTQWTATIDVNRMLETEEYLNGSSAWTLQTLWENLSDLWANDNRLINMAVPSVEPNYISVKMSNMELAFDDFREAIEGRGTITLTFIEPIPSTGSPTGTGVDSTSTF